MSEPRTQRSGVSGPAYSAALRARLRRHDAEEPAMSKPRVTVFICTGKECTKAWRRLGNGSPGKWLKRHIEEAGLPYKVTVVKTECMDRCEHAGCLCFQHCRHAAAEY